MKLHISFDTADIEKVLSIAHSIAQYTDTLKIDTPLIYKYGIEIVKKFQINFPNHIITADTKIINYTHETIPLFAQAGAHWITVMAGTTNTIIHSACVLAHSLNTKIMLDLSDSMSVAQSALDAKNLGVDALFFNQPYDINEPFTFTDKWESIHGNTDLPIFISAKITLSNIDQIISLKPTGVIIGSSITHSDNPEGAAQTFYEKIKAVPK